LNGKVKSPRYVCLLARVYEDLEQLNQLFSCIKKMGPYLENIKNLNPVLSVFPIGTRVFMPS